MTAIVGILALAGVVWGVIFALRGSLIAGCLTFLLTASCLSHTFLEFDLGPIPLTLDRLVIVGLVAAYVVQRQLGRTDPKPMAAADWLLIAFAGVLIFSTFTSNWRVSLPGDISPLWRLIFGYLMPMTLYWIVRQSPLTERRIGIVQGCLAGFGLYLAVTGLAEVTQQWWLVFPKYVADPKIGIHFGRARGPMVQAAAFGTCLAICFLAAWTWRARLGRLGQLTLLVLSPLYLAAVFYTYTRSAWAETALGIMVLLALTLKGRVRNAVIGSLVAAGLVVAVANWERLVGFDRDQSAADTRKSAEMRGSFAYVSWQMFLDRPLLGCGFGQYRSEVLPYLSDRTTDRNLQMIRGYVHHNTLLCILAENGGIGLLLFCGVLACWTKTAWRLYRSPNSPDWAKRQAAFALATLAIYLCQALSRDVTYTAVENLLLFFLAGINAGLVPLIDKAAPAATTVATDERRAAG